MLASTVTGIGKYLTSGDPRDPVPADGGFLHRATLMCQTLTLIQALSKNQRSSLALFKIGQCSD